MEGAGTQPKYECVQGRAALLCVMIGHVWEDERCTRPGCRSTRSELVLTQEEVETILALRAGKISIVLWSNPERG